MQLRPGCSMGRGLHRPRAAWRAPTIAAAGCQPSSHFSAAGLFHPARLGRPLFFAPARLSKLTRMYLPARACTLRRRTAVPAPACSSTRPWLFYDGFCCCLRGSFACATLCAWPPTIPLAYCSLLRSYLLARARMRRRRTAVPAPACSSARPWRAGCLIY